MNWDCTITEARLSEALDGLLSREEAAAYSVHLAGCARCQGLAGQVGAMLERMHGLEMVPEPPQLAERILEATLGPRQQKQGRRQWFAWTAGLWQPRFVMGAVTVAASIFIVIHASGISPAKIRRLDLNPANLLRAANRQAHLSYAHGAKFVNDLRVVYEIQSRLEPAQEPTAAPAPAVEPQSQPSSPSPQQKSEKKQPRDRSQLRAKTMFAVMLPGAATNLPNAFLSRSPR
jgi:Putative zinc-finger